MASSSITSFVSPRFVHTFSLRVVAGRTVELSESCDNDVGDVGVAELEKPIDKPGAAGGTENYV